MGTEEWRRKNDGKKWIKRNGERIKREESRKKSGDRQMEEEE